MDHTEQTIAFVFLETAKNKEAWKLERAGTSNGSTLPLLRCVCKYLAKCEDYDSDLFKSSLKSAESV